MTRARGAAPGSDVDFLIIGGGVTATALASLVLARRLSVPGRVAIVAEPPGPRAAAAPGAASDWSLRVFALSRASQRLLTICGVWRSLPMHKVCSYDRMCVWDATGEPDGTGSLTFDSAEIGEPNLGSIVEGEALQTQCRRAAAEAGAVFMEAGIEGVTASDGGVRVRLDDGRELQSRLLVAADGVDSKTRALLGIETAGHAYHQDALVAHVRTVKAHRNTAWQRFLPSGPLAFLPLPDGRSSIVWSAPRAEAARLRALHPAAFGAALASASGDALGACELTTPVASFPLKLQYALDYARPRAVLVGDAAHIVHPLAGQGLNLGLLDCATLAEVLSGDRPGDVRRGGLGTHRDALGVDREALGVDREALGEAKLLRRYERRRKAENLQAAAALDGLEQLFSSAHPEAVRLRVAGLGAVDRLPFVKRRLAMRALGLGGDVPKFLKADSYS